VQQLLAAQPLINSGNGADEVDWTPLMQVATLASVSLLISLGADVLTVNKLGTNKKHTLCALLAFQM
jgi:hypothetical protein